MKKLFLVGLLIVFGSPAHASVCGDVNADGQITVTDALTVLRASIGGTGELNCGTPSTTSTSTTSTTTTTTMLQDPNIQVRHYNTLTCEGEEEIAQVWFGGFPPEMHDQNFWWAWLFDFSDFVEWPRDYYEGTITVQIGPCAPMHFSGFIPLGPNRKYTHTVECCGEGGPALRWYVDGFIGSEGTGGAGTNLGEYVGVMRAVMVE
jgi:hypothetical protein